MQLYPIEFAKSIFNSVKGGDEPAEPEPVAAAPQPAPMQSAQYFRCSESHCNPSKNFGIVQVGYSYSSAASASEALPYFAPGTIIELDKIAGEPIDVLVNGKFVAKGEVVVIEESFGITNRLLSSQLPIHGQPGKASR